MLAVVVVVSDRDEEEVLETLRVVSESSQTMDCCGVVLMEDKSQPSRWNRD